MHRDRIDVTIRANPTNAALRKGRSPGHSRLFVPPIPNNKQQQFVFFFNNNNQQNINFNFFLSLAFFFSLNWNENLQTKVTHTHTQKKEENIIHSLDKETKIKCWETNPHFSQRGQKISSREARLLPPPPTINYSRRAKINNNKKKSNNPLIFSVACCGFFFFYFILKVSFRHAKRPPRYNIYLALKYYFI